MALNNRRGCQKSNEKYYIFSWTKNLTNQLQNKSVKHTYKDQEIVRQPKKTKQIKKKKKKTQKGIKHGRAQGKSKEKN